MNFILFLADFSVMKPEPGLLLWTVLIFALFWFLMARFAFKPIQAALKQRETDIQNSLDEAKRAREEMSNLKNENEKLLRQAQEERMKILKEANEVKDSIIGEARDRAKEEANKIVANARQEISNMRMAAITDMKNQIGTMAIDIAEKVLRKELQAGGEQERLVNSLVNEMKLN
jgi:F-type H+-transporting ATPase subunit b